MPGKPRPSVTGGGWISSPAGAYATDPVLGGKASFGFVVKGKKGASTPSGNLEFHLNAAKLRFHAAGYESLELEGGRATFQGVGTLKISGLRGDVDENSDRGFGFLVTVVDGQLGSAGSPDLFRIKIWDLDDDNAVVYDSQMGDADDADPTIELGGGSIVIHAGE
jgi:hypothetical protein